MLTLGPLGFAVPWMLAALAALPVIWWLLRVTPPAPRRVRFPAIRLLFELERKDDTAARTPLWLVILRLFLSALVIVALARPILTPGERLSGGGPLVIVVDDGWAAARGWERRRTTMDWLLDQAEREGRAVMLLATAPSGSSAAPEAPGLASPREVRTAAQALAPKPWAPDRHALVKRLEGISLPAPAHVFWLSDGLEDGDAFALAEALQRLGPLGVLVDPPQAAPLLMLPPDADATGLTARLTRVASEREVALIVQARGGDGRLLARERLILAPGASGGEVRLELPQELRNRLARLEIEDVPGAGSVILLDERWRRRPVGLVSGTPGRADQPLVGDLYFLDRALRPFTELRRGTVAELLKREIAVIVMTDAVALVDAERQALAGWMQGGGVLLRFAGPELARKPDALLPVALRGGDRVLGGAMSWSRPASLAPFPAESPFAGLVPSAEVMIRRQVLAEPTLDLPDKTWARLTDGTPLVTAEKRGAGWLALVHTTANTEWSDLPLSGLFVDMLRRVVALSQGIVGVEAENVLAPERTLDGFGRLGAPPPTAVGIAAREIDGAVAAPEHPPGFYAQGAVRRALNLAPGVGEPAPIERLPAGAARAEYGDAEREAELMPWLLALALLLAALDGLISLELRGLLRARRPVRVERLARAAALVALLVVGAPPAWAQAPAGEAFAMAAAREVRLGYVITGVEEVDAVSRAGLIGLSQVVTRRTAADMAEPFGVDPEKDGLHFFTLLYWPTVPAQRPPSPEAIRRLNEYLEYGGIIFFDTRDGGAGASLGGVGPGTQALRALTRGLNVPLLVPMPADHVIGRAFYLMREFPGRWTGGTLWVQRDTDRANDSVSSVIIGTNDWAGAWAVDEASQPAFAVVPGTGNQRELAYRFGINLVMYSLTGNYKGDQVHVPIILERLGK
ncbi:MAG: DUF4159 domain-containing protein [Proteobacteria bacterium]|nr:DUF4159 domain-containing protein [Pseudomonadota bacterium]